jgi:hypothetical protein
MYTLTNSSTIRLPVLIQYYEYTSVCCGGQGVAVPDKLLVGIRQKLKMSVPISVSEPARNSNCRMALA